MSQQWGEVNPQMSQQWREANPQMSNQWGEYMTLLATPGLPSCSNTDYLAENDAEDPIGDSFANESDDASEPDEAEYPIPPEDGPNDVDINVMAETFAQGRLDVGMLFKTKEELMEAVQDHSIRHARREYYVTESSKTKWRVLSKHSTEAFQQSTGSYVLGYVFWAFKPCIDGFQLCRKITSADGTHLYTKYKHKILIAAAMDGKSTEGDVGCALFLTVMAESLKQFVKDLCWQAGLEYQLRKFNRIMEEIKKQHVGAFVYLDQINKKKWTVSHDGGCRCGILTTNMSECINGVLKGFAACRHSQQSALVVTRRQNGHGINTHLVKISNRECSCGKWNQFAIPYSHAQKVCGAYNISVASMVKDYYDLMAYNNTYSKHFEPVQSEDYWDDPNFQLVHDPTIRISTRSGRNQTARIHNEMDWQQTRARQESQQ
ncbi:hypothetical protein Sango_0095300 [Sesamum angolense]|uniref:Zinc finger PMZ-type domain-containing protein n=1 Tax=Sesamum angolense TaxID=2727404 RepID=A0AAE2C5X4_9LAMI|nr:hypothetical protein Sango_0095300 [Sesamum angolense]